jgi:hypothetical protein
MRHRHKRSVLWLFWIAVAWLTRMVDVRCDPLVSMLDTSWRGVSVGVLRDGVGGDAAYAVIDCYGGYPDQPAGR